MERGGTTGERFAWAAVALVVLLAAHLLPALTRNETLQIKLIALALWLVCILGTTYGHATFFLEAQQHAGAQRAATLQAELPSAPTRPVAVRGRDVIARDQARVAQQLAAARAERCAASCAALAARREALSAKLAALATEAEVAKRAELAADRAEEERQMLNARLDKARLDPVTSRVAQFLQLPHDVVDLTIALVFGLLLECVACIGWLQVFGQRAVGPVERGHAHPSVPSLFSSSSSAYEEDGASDSRSDNVGRLHGSTAHRARGRLAAASAFVCPPHRITGVEDKYLH
ncbi:TPA: hypothetical protein U2Q23_005930 [Burkholderia multivorans]|uniref:Uncharacterized protein n=1 Tax=Burkholderia multivorans CGD2 TaxID=513052 RepID=B9BP03_9BURK|nr:conserved hypothetical protein [Burkholderia multivorans CGD2]EEE13691.1 conserved hypothetical protein [Burkholderia multivorans CGD2M]HEM7873421.1 hypothetical protein [Burkholderia multivorans]HEM8539734.1 hypothetical protein [Burkholderia multivorans]